MPLQEADYGMTDQALGQNPRYAGDERLLVRFYTAARKDDGKSAEEGRPIFRDAEYIRILMPGNKESIVCRPVTDMDIARFRKQYDAWKANEKEPIEGTLLETVSRDPLLRFNPSQIEELRYFNITTVEQLANVPDVHTQKFMGLNAMKTAAKKYLEVSKDRAVTTRLEAELETRDNQIAVLQEAMTSLQAQLKAVQEGPSPKRGPPKPPKAA